MKTIPRTVLRQKLSDSALVILFVTGLTGCSSGNGDNPPPVDPWNAPVGAPIAGVTLSDGWTDLREVPAPVNISGGWTDSVAVSASGTTLFFGYGRWDFPEFYNSNSTVFNPTGPLRPGMTGDYFKMFRADLGINGWTVSYVPFNGASTVDEFAASPNVAEDVIVFIRFVGGTGDIYYTLKTADTWSTPIALPSFPPINTPCNDDNPFVVGSLAAGLTLYFESNRVDPGGTTCGSIRHVYYTEYSPAGGGSFSAVQLVPGLNGAGASDEDTQPFVTPDKSKAYWTGIRSAAYGVFSADLSGGNYVNVHPVAVPTSASPFTGNTVLIGEANVAEVPQGWLMYMMCGIAQSESGGQPRDVQLKVCVARKLR